MEKLCTLCPRKCAANRQAGERGICGQTAELMVARAALHYWEEPCISGSEGSGAVFFSGCPLHCVFCQNGEIAAGNAGKKITVERLAEIFLELQEKGANNINLVTAGHFTPQVIKALESSRRQGLKLPIVYNTSSYENVDNIKSLEGYVDIYLPDFKYMDGTLAKRYSHAPDYSIIAKAALAEMVRQTGPARFRDGREDGLMERGTIVRHLLLPGCGKDSKAVIRYLYETYHNEIYISIMNQFTPIAALADYPELNRKVTDAEYEEVVDYAIELGVECGFIQEGDTAEESFIPAFDCEGV
jgi:putative pyruvate formate lyase activating enzyme